MVSLTKDISELLPRSGVHEYTLDFVMLTVINYLASAMLNETAR